MLKSLYVIYENKKGDFEVTGFYSSTSRKQCSLFKTVSRHKPGNEKKCY